jgi:hypothetical protein
MLIPDDKYDSIVTNIVTNIQSEINEPPNTIIDNNAIYQRIKDWIQPTIKDYTMNNAEIYTLIQTILIKLLEKDAINDDKFSVINKLLNDEYGNADVNDSTDNIDTLPSQSELQKRQEALEKAQKQREEIAKKHREINIEIMNKNATRKQAAEAEAKIKAEQNAKTLQMKLLEKSVGPNTRGTFGRRRGTPAFTAHDLTRFDIPTRLDKPTRFIKPGGGLSKPTKKTAKRPRRRTQKKIPKKHRRSHSKRRKSSKTT